MPLFVIVRLFQPGEKALWPRLRVGPEDRRGDPTPCAVCIDAVVVPSL